MDKDYFAKVSFSGTQADKQREFLLAMTGMGIITLSKDEIDHMYKEDQKNPYGIINRIVLHGEGQKKKFENVMGLCFADTEYDISDEPEKDLAEWLARKERERIEGDENG